MYDISSRQGRRFPQTVPQSLSIFSAAMIGLMPQLLRIIIIGINPVEERAIDPNQIDVVVILHVNWMELVIKLAGAATPERHEAVPSSRRSRQERKTLRQT